jgi:hypothetical protein
MCANEWNIPNLSRLLNSLCAKLRDAGFNIWIVRKSPGSLQSDASTAQGSQSTLVDHTGEIHVSQNPVGKAETEDNHDQNTNEGLCFEKKGSRRLMPKVLNSILEG